MPEPVRCRSRCSGFVDGEDELDHPLAGKEHAEPTGTGRRQRWVSQNQLLRQIFLAASWGSCSWSPIACPGAGCTGPGCHRHPTIRPSAGALSPRLLRQILLSSAVYASPATSCCSARVSGRPTEDAAAGAVERDEPTIWALQLHGSDSRGSGWCCAPTPASARERLADGLVQGQPGGFPLPSAPNQQLQVSAQIRARSWPSPDARATAANVSTELRLRLPPHHLVLAAPARIVCGQSRVTQQGQESALRRSFADLGAVARPGTLPEVLLRPKQNDNPHCSRPLVPVRRIRLSTDEMKGDQLRPSISPRWPPAFDGGAAPAGPARHKVDPGSGRFQSVSSCSRSGP